MAVRDSIEPFPLDVDSDAFGHWLSGFTDGEGCFCVGSRETTKGVNNPVSFAIRLRRDDRPVLLLIQSYFQCGVVYDHKERAHSKSQSVFVSNRVPDLFRVIIPHFEKHPLRAKKRRDFEIWKQAVELVFNVTCRKPRCRGLGGGFLPRWRKSDRAKLVQLTKLLREQRTYKEDPLASQTIPTPCHVEEDPMLF